MRVGSSVNPYSAHQAGMSALWHDVDYVPEQRFETPVVRTGLEDMALPSEHHQLPEGVPDPFDRMEAVFDVAAAQMERGLKGASFLHGKPPPEPVIQAKNAQLGNKQAPVEVMAQQDMRRERDALYQASAAASITVPKASGSSKTAADGEREAVAHVGATGDVGDAIGAAATFVPMAAGQAVQTVAQGPLPVLASQAVTTTAAVLSAANVTATGIAEGLKEEPLIVRRGLKTRV
jgi:hypothetical protein